MSFAVVKTGGKQYKVAEGDKILIEKIDHEVGEEFDFEEVCTYLKSDSEKESNFLIYRSNYINSLCAFQVNKPEILRIIDNFCNAFSDNFYDELKLKIDIEKYNL